MMFGVPGSIDRGTLIAALNGMIVVVFASYDKAPSDLADPLMLSALTQEERTRLSSIIDGCRKTEFLVGRLMVRCILSLLLDTPPPTVPIRLNSRGRPILRLPSLVDYDFNLSHSHGHLMLGISRLGHVGVDVELGACHDLTLARRFMTTIELTRLMQMPSGDRGARVARIWTIKEAWSKALGNGLRVPLRHLCTGLMLETQTTTTQWCTIRDIAVPAAVSRVCDHPIADQLRYRPFFVTLSQLREFITRFDR